MFVEAKALYFILSFNKVLKGKIIITYLRVCNMVEEAFKKYKDIIQKTL